MGDFDYGKYFGEIQPLADALRENEARVWESTPGKHPQPHQYALWLGCNVLRTVNLAESIVEVLKAMGVDFVALGGPANCCGAIHNLNGDGQVADKMMHHTLGNLVASRPEAILVYCPSCHFRMDEAVPRYPTLDVPHLHVTEFLADRLSELKFVNRIEKRVGLHAHHHAGQQRRDAEATRKLLSAVPGLEVVDFHGDAEWGRHCSPSQLEAMGPGRFDELAHELAGEARRQGLDAIATVYHSCYREWCGKQAELGMEIVNYVTLLCEGLGLRRYEETYKALKLAQEPEQAFRTMQPVARRRRLSTTRLRESLHTHFAKPKG
jgi:Fe-S oxidoreductase